MTIIRSDNNIYLKPLLCFDDYIYKHSVAINRLWDDEVIDAILEHLSDDTDILDIGANIGLVTLGLIQKATQRSIRINKIHCFECDPTTFHLLSQNMTSLPIVQLYPFAVGQTRQLCTLQLNKYNRGCNYIDNTIDNTGQTFYSYPHHTVNQDEYALKATQPTVFIPSLPLDDILYQFKKRISVIKIDIEGFEFQALKGAEQLIKTHYPVIIV